MKQEQLPKFITDWVSKRLSDEDIAELVVMLMNGVVDTKTLSTKAQKRSKETPMSICLRAEKDLSTKERVDFAQHLAKKLHDRMKT